MIAILKIEAHQNGKSIETEGTSKRQDWSIREIISRVEEDDRSGNYFKKDELLYHSRKPAGGAGKDSAMEQLVLPKKFRKAVLNVAHCVPTAGHLGKCKMAGCILQRFHWHTAMWQATAKAAQNARSYPKGKSGTTSHDFCTI